MLKTIAKFINSFTNFIIGPWHYAKNVSAFNEYVNSELFKARELKFDYYISFIKFLNLDFNHYYSIAFRKNWFNIIFRPTSIKPIDVVLFAIFVTAKINKEDYGH